MRFSDTFKFFSIVLICAMFLSAQIRETAVSPIDVSRTELLMGTFVQVKLSSRHMERNDLVALLDQVFFLAQELESKFSIFNPESEINLLNAKKEMAVSPELFELLKLAENIKKKTRGKFDITVAPVLKDAGFYQSIPDEIKELFPEDPVTGVSLSFSDENNKVKIPQKSWLDVSGIAKGFIVEHMGRFLNSEGIDTFLINAGGDILSSTGEDVKPWRVGLRLPGTEEIKAVFLLSNMAVATSGDYENVLTEYPGAKPVSHIVDPSRARPLERVFSSVTVISSSVAEADAFATGFMILPPDEVKEIAKGIPGMEVVLVKRDGRVFEVTYTEGAKQYVEGGRF